MQTILQESETVSVLVTAPVDRLYDYRAGAPAPAPGSYVVVPLGKRLVRGVVWGPGAGDVPPARLKDIEAVYDAVPMDAATRRWVDAMASYTLTPRGDILKLCMAGANALEPPKRKTKEKPLPATDLNADAGIIDLSGAQGMAAARLCELTAAGKYAAALLYGVTGSGKTETYFEAVAAALKQGRQVLILLPEIALSNAFIDRFKKRFGGDAALWHSEVPPGAKKRIWKGVMQGAVKVVVGARSALFLPFADLGLIVVDEEHDPAFKQEEGVLYNARDMAVLRASMAAIPVVLVSATPSLETMANAWNGRYELLELPDRYGGAQMPGIHVIDMRSEKTERQHFIAAPVIEAVRATLEKNEQALLFLNRRGYAPLTLCRACGHRVTCPRCTAWLVMHQKTDRLSCHHCGYTIKPPCQCPSCNEEDTLAPCGPGVERVRDEIASRFPQARTLILASDTADTQKALKDALQSIHAHAVDIVIGTQIIAKGHHFPKLSFVGVVDADLGLSGGDLRASERTYQLLHQVAGRAGREKAVGEVFLQTFMPDHTVMQALATGRADDFLRAELAQRDAAQMPPFTRLVAVVVSSLKESDAEGWAVKLAREFPRHDGVRLFGPAQAPIYRIRGRYRQRLLIQAHRNVNVQSVIATWLATHKTPSSVRVAVDVDPQSFM